MADKTIAQLPLNATPSEDALVEVYDTDTTPKSGRSVFKTWVLRAISFLTGEPGDVLTRTESGDVQWQAPLELADPTAMIGLSVVNGTAETAMRSDAAPPIDQGIDPFWTGNHRFTKVRYAANSLITLLANNTTLTGSNNFVYQPIASDDATAANRVFDIDTASVANGQLLVLIWSGANAGKIVNGGNMALNADWVPVEGDLLGLIFDGTSWREQWRFPTPVINPTDKFVPFNNSGAFSDSPISIETVAGTTQVDKELFVQNFGGGIYGCRLRPSLTAGSAPAYFFDTEDDFGTEDIFAVQNTGNKNLAIKGNGPLWVKKALSSGNNVEAVWGLPVNEALIAIRVPGINGDAGSPELWLSRNTATDLSSDYTFIDGLPASNNATLTVGSKASGTIYSILLFGSSSKVCVQYGVGGSTCQDIAGTVDPEGAVTASQGSTYRWMGGGAGTSFYVKESGSGNTGWVAK